MNNNIDAVRSPFFPKSRNTDINQTGDAQSIQKLKRNAPDRMKELSQITKNDAKVDIPKAVRDFSRIKSVVDKAPDINKSDRIAQLKQQINSGEYKINYDGLAEKLIEQEF